MRRAAVAALLVTLAGCVHRQVSRSHPTARLAAVHASVDPAGALLLDVRYQLDGLRYSTWSGRAARLDVSIDDVPFASATVEARALPGDALEVPLALAMPRRREGSGLLRVRLRGELELEAGEATLRVPTDGEATIATP